MTLTWSGTARERYVGALLAMPSTRGVPQKKTVEKSQLVSQGLFIDFGNIRWHIVYRFKAC